MRWFLFLLCLCVPAPASAEAWTQKCSSGKWGHVSCIRDAHFVFDTCALLQSAARRHRINPHFFARLIWQESRFDPYALSPANAKGIAQFIDSTAQLRGLSDPYNPAEALEHSAHYLGELVRRFGNPGMAAIAYNGGEARAAGFLRGKGLAKETWDYVPIITGLGARNWRDRPPKKHDFRLSKAQRFLPACYALARNRKISGLRSTPVYKSWGVQMAAGSSKSQARRLFGQRIGSCKRIVEKETLEIIYKRHRGPNLKGFYMARLGRNDRDGAFELCNQLRSAGCACAVYKN